MNRNILKTIGLMYWNYSIPGRLVNAKKFQINFWKGFVKGARCGFKNMNTWNFDKDIAENLKILSEAINEQERRGIIINFPVAK